MQVIHVFPFQEPKSKAPKQTSAATLLLENRPSLSLVLIWPCSMWDLSSPPKDGNHSPAAQHRKRGAVFTAGLPGTSLGSTHKFKLDHFVSATGPEGGAEGGGEEGRERTGPRTPPLRTEATLGAGTAHRVFGTFASFVPFIPQDHQSFQRQRD